LRIEMIDLGFVDWYWILSTIGVFLPGLWQYLHPGQSSTVDSLILFGKLRLSPSKKNDWQKWIEVPKSSFQLFYVIATIVSLGACAIVIPVLIGLSDTVLPVPVFNLVRFLSSNRPSKVSDPIILGIGLILYSIHCIRRLYESTCISVFSSTARINILHLILGCSFYVNAVITQLSLWPCDNTITSCKRISSWSISRWQLALIVIFLLAMLSQHVTFRILANLRKDSKGKVTTQKHLIPYGAPFRFLSSPHFTVEILIYLILSVWYEFALSTVLMSIFVLANQSLVALSTHRWYLDRFGDKYPNDRKALVPFLY